MLLKILLPKIWSEDNKIDEWGT